MFEFTAMDTLACKNKTISFVIPHPPRVENILNFLRMFVETDSVGSILANMMKEKLIIFSLSNAYICLGASGVGITLSLFGFGFLVFGVYAIHRKESAYP